MSPCSSKTRCRPHPTTATMAHDVGKVGPWSVWRDEDLLVEYAQKQTREAFEELVHRYKREMYGYLRRYLRSAELAEDAFQATFLRVHLKCRQFDPCRRFRPWLYRIATNRAIDLLRQNRRHKAVSLNAGTLDRGSRAYIIVSAMRVPASIWRQPRIGSGSDRLWTSSRHGSREYSI